MAVVATLTAVASAVAAGFAYAGAAATFSWTAAAIAFGSSLLLSFAGQLLAPKPPNAGSFGDGGDFTRQFRQPVSERRYIYGESRASGATAFIGSTGDNKYLHVVIMLASHEVAEIGEVIINDVSIAPDQIGGDGVVTSGTFANYVRIKKHLGSPTQNADSDLVSEVSDWTSDHKLSEIAYIYVRYEFNRDVFPNGIPNVSAYVRGKKLYDPRTDTTEYSANAALIARDYLTDTKIGFEVPSTRIDTTSLTSSANNCDEIQEVTNRSFDITAADDSANTITIAGDQLFLQRGDRVRLSGSNFPAPLDAETDYYVIPYQRSKTPRVQLASSLSDAMQGNEIDLTTSGTISIQDIIKQAEPRYYGGGIIKSDAEIGKNLQEILSGMGGRAIYAGGKWRILSAQYYAPTISFNESDIITSVSVTTKKSKKDRFNRVRGIFTGLVNNDNPTDYPPVENALYQSEDGEIIDRDLPLPFTQRPSAAQRIAKIELERQRQEIIFSASFKLTALQVQAGDNIYFSFDRYGWSDKIFEVIDWSLNVEGDNEAPIPVVNMTLQENAEGVYDWNNGEETTYDLAPNTNLPDPFTVPQVSGFSLSSFLIDTQLGDKTFKVLAAWQESPNSFVTQGGFFEVEFKRTTESEYKSAGKVDGDIFEMEIAQLQPDVTYDIRIVAFNNVRAKSAYSTINNFTVGSTVTTDTEDWENETLSRTGDDWENDTLSSEDWE